MIAEVDPNPTPLSTFAGPFVGFDEVGISVASPDQIRKYWSKGEVKNPETINYRTFKPEKGGLFCERIFGPTKDWECSCGKYKRIKHKGIICDRCGVEVTLARVRRERMGHIELAVPVTHIWFYKYMPSRIGLLLEKTSRELERVIYYEDYMVIDPGPSHLQPGQLLTEAEYRLIAEEYGDKVQVGMGGEAIMKLLERIDLQKTAEKLEEQLNATKSKQIRKKLATRLKLVRGFINSNTRPEWMVLTVLPVIPPDLRPLVPLEGGRFATSDLNDLYRRVINRNNRLKTLLQLKTPEVIIRNEKRMLQEAVDALFDNGRHGRPVTGTGNRPLKSLSDMLKGKTGRFRQNLLGKRVDYSGRSVIVIGPELKLHQCGLPKKMALVLFEPFIIRRLKELGYVHTVRSAKKMIERQTPEVWNILEEVTKNHTVLLNRAPTLHRLSIQAFEPILIEGEAIRIHPLVCTAYNADFDGDQMAVHVPLSIEAQLEARTIMLAPNNILGPSNGRPITTPSQDIPLGCYYLTANPRGKEAEKKPPYPLFSSVSEVEFALAEGVIRKHSRIRYVNPDYGRKTIFGDPNSKIIETTAGRVIFNEIWPPELGFYNKTAGKKQLSEIIWQCFKNCGQAATVAALDRLKELGFREATRAGISIGVSDMIIPKEKHDKIQEAFAKLKPYEEHLARGIITKSERNNKFQEIWTHTVEEVVNYVFRAIEHNERMEEHNPIFVMVDSGARGNRTQVKQLAGLRGLMANHKNEIIQHPILSNFREGLSVLEYYISTHGARKGLVDTALKTADAGYLTRKLVDACQDAIITEEDCGTANGIYVRPIYQADEEVVSLAARIIGRTYAGDKPIKDPDTNEVILAPNQLIDEDIAAKIQELGFEEIKIRSPLTCETHRGVCAKCYGRNLATGQPAKLGDAVGIIAAQSVGEPGTQLTLRTFHVGGTASQTFKKPIINAEHEGTIVYKNLVTVQTRDGNYVVLRKSEDGKIAILDKSGLEVESHSVPRGATIYYKDGAHVRKGAILVRWNPHTIPIVADKAGKVEFRDMANNITYQRNSEGKIVICQHSPEYLPQIVITPSNGDTPSHFPLPVSSQVLVVDGQKVTPGDYLASVPRYSGKNKDIIGGLARLIEILEARHPVESATAIISRIDGYVDICSGERRREIIVRDPTNKLEEVYPVPLDKHIIVNKDDFVKKGQPLTAGAIDPHELLEIRGPYELQQHLLNEIQEVYRLQGIEINDKHIEIITRQMLRKVKVLDPGDTNLLMNDQVERSVFEEENRTIIEKGGKPAVGIPVLLGITKASFETDSFISAASFQDTGRVLTDAATLGKIDYLRGFKENVIMGHLIPAGTGFRANREIELVKVENNDSEEQDE